MTVRDMTVRDMTVRDMTVEFVQRVGVVMGS